MKKIILIVIVIAGLVSCSEKKTEKAFEVSGTISNSTATMIYLEELPMATMQATVVDSVKIGKNGKFVLHAGRREATVYNLRLDRSYPFATLINDTSKITVDVTFSKENTQFPEKYEVKGSTASQQMKDFMFAFNTQLQSLFYNDFNRDSLAKKGAPDSVLNAMMAERINTTKAARTLAEDAMKRSKNPALTVFILGYYQNTANNPSYQLKGLNNEEVNKILNDEAAEFPDHTGLAALKRSIAGWVGQQAPEIALPDPDGKTVTLSSYKGKYVLVDFWASWCKPCRNENPNVVKAWNRFKGKNFAILGVSLDMEGQKDKWLKAVMEDKLTWTHVSDLRYWSSPVVPLYNIEGIPYNVLVDPEGKIIAERLFGPALEEKLAEILQ